MDNQEIELQALITEREGMIAENALRRWSSPPYGKEDFDAITDKMRALKKPGVTVTLPKNLEDLPKGEPLPCDEPFTGRISLTPDEYSELQAAKNALKFRDLEIEELEKHNDTLLNLLEYAQADVYNRRTVDKIRDTIELVRGHRR